MPRLPVWAGCVVIACGGYYGFYHRFYLPRHTARRELEVMVEAEKSELQSLLRRYALLCHSMQNLPYGTCTTNRERISFFCELQRLREALYNLPLAAQSAADKRAVLRNLDKLEAEHCTSLNFRDEALALWQVLTCQFCFGLYILCFRLIDPVLQRVGSVAVAVEQLRRQMLHLAAKWIMRCLSVPVSMTLEESFSALSNASDDGKVNSNSGIYYLVFLPQHWVEVVGFWACPTNPMLLSTRVRMLVKPSVTSAMPFEMHWRERWLQKGLGDDCTFLESTCSDTKKHACAAESGSKGFTVNSSFGYPLVSSVARCRGVEEENGAAVDALHLLPVVSAGLPRVLFVSDELAQPDLQLRKTREEIYRELQQRQFPLGSLSSRYAALEQHSNGDASCAKKRKALWEEQLRVWRRRGGIPLWHRTTWGSVYGGVEHAGNRDLRMLSFCVGPPCHASELISEQMELQRRFLMEERVELMGKPQLG